MITNTTHALITGKAKLAGVAGWPISQSKSPRMHNHWLRTLGIDGAYVPLAIQPKRFETAIRGLQAAGFKGLNVTMPHKEAAHDLMDNLSQSATLIGAVNTIVFKEDGSMFGDNTDGYGFVENIRQSAPDFRFDAGPALILGAGGAAKSIVYSLLEAGVPEVRICNRTIERAAELRTMNVDLIKVVDWDKRTEACEGTNLLVNTTALGMTGKVALDMPLNALPNDALVTDIVYTPLQTELLKAAAERGNMTVDGIGMLLHQAVRGFSYWFDQTPVVDDTLRDLMLAI